MPGGLCTAQCATTACPAGAVCVPTGRMGELCAASCASDADCRAGEGYVCDPLRKACFLPFAASPKLAECPGETRPGSAWSPLAVLTSAETPGAYQFEPSAVVTPAGDVVAIHTGGAASFFAPSFLNVTRIPATGAPEAIALPTTKRMHFDPWAAIDRAGTIHAVWLGHDGGGVDLAAEIGYARSTDGGKTWSAPVAIHDPADCAGDKPFCLDKPMIAVGPAPGKKKGEVVRAFYSSDGLRMRSSADGGATWSEPTPVLDATYADVAIDDRGAVHVVAADAAPRGAATWGSTEHAIVYTRSTDGETFAAPVIASAPGESIPFFFVNPTIAVDRKRGLTYVAYAAGTPDGAWNIQLAISKDGGATWRHQTLAGATPACANHAVPDLAVSAGGDLHATWYEYAGGAGYRAYTRCASGGARCDVPVAIGPPMARYELVRHSPRWLGEYTALVVDDKHRALHALWTQIIGDDTASAGRIVHTRTRLVR